MHWQQINTSIKACSQVVSISTTHLQNPSLSRLSNLEMNETIRAQFSSPLQVSFASLSKPSHLNPGALKESLHSGHIVGRAPASKSSRRQPTFCPAVRFRRDRERAAGRPKISTDAYHVCVHHKAGYVHIILYTASRGSTRLQLTRLPGQPHTGRTPWGPAGPAAISSFQHITVTFTFNWLL